MLNTGPNTRPNRAIVATLPTLAAAIAVVLSATVASTSLAVEEREARRVGGVVSDTTADGWSMPRVLAFSKTGGFRHGSIPAALDALDELGALDGFVVDRTEDAADFTDGNLTRYQAVVFVSTTGDVLDDEQQSAFERYIGRGGGYVGIHAASDTEYDWPWYGELVGAYFGGHPSVQQATITVEDRTHPSTEHLGDTWVRTDEWYDFRASPRSEVNVLLTLDESTYSGGGMGADHPIAWYHSVDGGRAWYTGGGHTDASYAEPDFRRHLLGGIRYAIGPFDPPDGLDGPVTATEGAVRVLCEAGPCARTSADHDPDR